MEAAGSVRTGIEAGRAGAPGGRGERAPRLRGICSFGAGFCMRGGTRFARVGRRRCAGWAARVSDSGGGGPGGM